MTAMTADERAARVAARDRIRIQRVEKAGKKGVDVASSYLSARGLLDPADVTIPVECPLPGYTHLTVHYRTNNQAARMRSMPRIGRTPESERLRAIVYGLPDGSPRKAIAIAKLAAMSPLDEGYLDLWHHIHGLEMTEPDYEDAQTAYDEAMRPIIDEFIEKRNRWMATFVRRIDGWNFVRVTDYDEDGEPIYEPIPEPDPMNPQTFGVFDEELEDLGNWLPFDGYEAALAKSLGPNFRGKPARPAGQGGDDAE